MTEPDAPSRAGAPRSPQDAESLARFQQRMALPLIASAVLPLFLLPGGDYPLVGALVFVGSWLVFLVDLIEHTRRVEHYFRTWLGRFDLVVVILTAPWFVVLGPSDSKFVLLIRLARVARLFMATRGARVLFERLGRVALIALVVIVLGAGVGYRAEHLTNPGFKTYGDALWWAVVTLTTVGYGDIVPNTTAGRVDGVMIMVTGVAVLGLLAGSMASFFHINGGSATQSGGEPSEPSEPAEPSAALVSEVSELRTEIARLTDEVARFSRPDRA